MTGGTLSVLVRIATLLAEVFARTRPRYEPAHHYMRGPGPKCREKGRLAMDG
jgi:hypothetical protein